MPEEIELTEPHSRLIDLVDYVGQMAQMLDRAVFALREYGQLLFHEADLQGRIGISHDVHDQEGAIWLKIERLSRNDPPPVPEECADWVTVSRDPFRSPKVTKERVETLPASRAAELVDNNIVAQEDVQETLRRDGPEDLRDVIFRLDRVPQTKEAIDAYISESWLEWAELEKPRRETIAIYDKFFALQQIIQSEGGDTPLEVVWGIGVARWRNGAHEFDHPLVEQLVELNIDPEDGAITIRSRSAEPQIALRPYLAIDNGGAESVLQFGKQFLSSLPEEHECSPFIRRTFEPVLRQAVSQIDPQGSYYPDTNTDITNRSLPPIGDNLCVTDTWAIYGRKRSDNFYVADLDRLREEIQSVDTLPEPARRLVTEPSDETTYTPAVIDIGGGLTGFYHGAGGSVGGGSISTPSASIDDARSHDFFFPKAFNDEQVKIIRRLMESDGVVVQGPPGTGKTHTIANIICHYLATGKRVLVTSKGEPALSVLRDHIPEGIRDLVISLLTSERDGLRQLERAVGLLADTATQINPRELERDIAAEQQSILALQSRVKTIEEQLNNWAVKHLKRVGASAGAQGSLPMDLARKIVQEKNAHAWFPDRPSPERALELGDDDIASLRDARKSVGADLIYMDVSLPSIPDLPDAASLIAVHQDLVHAKALDEKADSEQIPLLSLTAENAINRAKVLQQEVDQIVEFHKLCRDSPWVTPIFEKWVNRGPRGIELGLFEDLLSSMDHIATRRASLLGQAISISDDALEDPVVTESIARAATGKKPFGAQHLFQGAAKKRFSQIKVAGRPPESIDDWRIIFGYVGWRREISEFVARWSALRSEFGLPELGRAGNEAGKWIADTHSVLSRGRSIATSKAAKLRKELPDLFPYGIDINRILTDEAAAVRAAEAIRINLSKQRLIGSRQRVEELIARLGDEAGPLIEKLRSFATQSVGNAGVSDTDISVGWQALTRELARLNELDPAFQTIERVTSEIALAGAPKWAQVLRHEAVIDGADHWMPSTWRESWEWARIEGYLRQIDGRDSIRKLSAELVEKDEDLKKAFAKVVEQRTYLGLKKNITDRIGAALAMFTTAIRNIGRGTGIRARRFRRDARDAMERSYAAIPCWIMPQWRISESLPAKLGSFDLVVIDEASQSDISALPAILRGKKVLIVGDDKQVSPTAPFIEERKILQLKHNYLRGQPFGAAMLPGSSLYGLAQAMFPGSRIMLREHFRCVEPIIRFSFQFYSEDLIPLRLPKESERLDPPLIDVHVPTGVKKGQVNLPEAAAIVDEIEKVVADPAYSNRSLGVVSLIGGKQAQLVQTLLLERIGESAFLRHNIACGDAATFQGKERDIMFISMVASPGSRTAQTGLPFQQRFNVALSRARDRQYLFHSVTEEMLSNADDLKAKVLKHFRSPMDLTRGDGEDLLGLCDSGFEREVLKALLDRGYRATPQVKAGAYFIDIVVEGTDDRRLAIELDGDKYHGPEKWADDLARQRVLERMGWVFWRCWGSSWTLDPEGCLEDLTGTMRRLGIEPIGGQPKCNVYTEFRVVADDEAQTAETAIEQDTAAIEAARASAVQELNADQRSQLEPAEEGLVVSPGDRVLFSYNDEPDRQYMITLSTTEHDPDNLVINSRMPLAKALVGYAEEEEVEIPAGEGTRWVTIRKIERGEIAEGVS